ncbi:RelA/SpoT family protein [Marinicella rhabdoformis]|uniref:RelA/SpoT family protein n=1 Tax=Marinicella rhabdoformis TaxID=2580566 RepID=UPI0012AEBE87
MNGLSFTSQTMSHKAVQAAFKLLKEKTNAYLNTQEKEQLRKAVHFGAYCHEKQIRKSGEPYITHPITVAAILATLRVDVDTLIAGVLHDTIEDTDATYQQLTGEFNADVAYLVEGVTKLDKIKFRNIKEAQAETFVKMLFAMAEDIRVIIIKLSDRLHNMRTISAMSVSGQRRISQETIDVYAPIAERLGLKSIQKEMERHAFQALHPNQSAEVETTIARIAGNRKKAVDRIRKTIEKSLLESGMAAKVVARQKSAYSAYKKAQLKKLEIEDIHDLFGVRIIVKELPQCYLALGIIHNIYPPNENGFKDYIAVPKQNGYQSLHTVVTGPYALKLEVQIRTEEMDHLSEAGVAAHWIYKQKDGNTSPSLNKARNWLNSLLKLQKDSVSSLEFYENLKKDLGTDEIYVFTPKGDLIQLPKRSTVLDFAFGIHTSVGSHAESVQVNGETKSLAHELKTGDTVSIKTSDDLKVHADWLRHVRSSKARTAIRKELKQIEDSDAMILGHRMLDRALDTYDHSFEQVDNKSIKRALKHYQLNSLDDMLKAFAYGELLPSIVAKKMLPMMKQRRISGDYIPKEALTIDGSEGSIVHYPNCCQPLPGDKIMGHLSQSKGVVIHRNNCTNLREISKNNPERLLMSSWALKTRGVFKSTLVVDVINKTGVLASLAAVIAEQGVNIVSIDQADKDSGFTELVFEVNVENKPHAEDLMNKLQSHRDVLNVRRKYDEKYH